MDSNKKERSISGIDTVTLGGGCFWCIEAIFKQLKGVIKVIPGYSGGSFVNPTYKDVCEGKTGHAEVCQVIFDVDIISFDELLEVFWVIHDPTTVNRQENDIGDQYRSVIFYHSKEQRESAEEYKAMLNSTEAYDKPVVTEILPFVSFYKAEEYYRNYYGQNADAPYCNNVIFPKMEKFKKVFKDKLKTE